MKQVTLLVMTIMGSILLSTTASASNAEDRYMYIGSELGLSEPVVKNFEHEGEDGSKSKMHLKQSRMFGGRIGYSFYPSMMVEVSFTHQPKYRLAYTLPEKGLAGGLVIPKTAGITNVSANVITLNWIYELPKQFAGLKPYVILGAGIAQVSVKPTTSETDALAPVGLGNNVTFFKINKTNSNCFTWQIGGGIARDIGANLSIDLGAKLQVVNNIKVKYDTLDQATMDFSPASPIKKTIGVGEFTLGFTFKIPV